MINIRRPNTDHRADCPCRCVRGGVPRCNHKNKIYLSYSIRSVCQICNGHHCGNPDCDSSIGYASDEHFGLRCDTCPMPREPGPPDFWIDFKGCQAFFVETVEQCGPDYKDDDPEVLRGTYCAGEPRIQSSTDIYHFCMSTPESAHLRGKRVYGRTNHRRTYEPPHVEWESGHVYRTWDVCEDCKVPVYKSIRRYDDRLRKESYRREKEYHYQLSELRKGRKILADVKRLLKEKKTPVAMQSMQGCSR